MKNADAVGLVLARLSPRELFGAAWSYKGQVISSVFGTVRSAQEST
jgi:hypothetical protein